VNDETVRLSLVGRVFRRRWRLLTALAILGAAVGFVASLLFSPGYGASADVLLQGPREPDEVQTETQVATSSAVLDKAAEGLRWGKTGADLKDSVVASVSDGNIIQITGYASTPERAQQLADRVANEFVSFSARLLTDTTDAAAQVSQEQQQSLRQQIIDTNRRISDLHRSAGKGNTIDSVGVRTELESLRTTLAEAMARIDELDSASGAGKIAVMAPADRPTGPAAPTMLHFVAGGAVLFLLLGVFGHLFRARGDRRLRHEEQIVSAAGSSLLGGIDVPDEPASKQVGWRVRLRRLVADDRPWHLPDLPVAVDERGLELRYRRLLSRLCERAPDATSVLVVVPQDDPSARRAADRLVRTAGEDLPRLRVVETPTTRPIVPDDPAAAGVLVVVTAGTRTSWELVDLSESCTDAGHEMLGVLVTHRTRPLVPGRSTGRTPGATEDRPAATVMAGSA
jgi:capsular polysaccharide biosynthesis protein